MDFKLGDPVSTIVSTVGGLLDKIIPDPAQRDAAKLALYNAQQNGQLEEMRTALSAIISDSQSQDKWTSRARPSFLYVVYILILFGIPMGILSAYAPDKAAAIANGFGLWLRAIPDPMYALFGTVMTGYILGRSYEKGKGVA